MDSVEWYDDQQEKVDAVIAWGSSPGNCFDLSFVESLSEWLDEKGSLTDAQEEALDNIIDKFGINTSDWA